MPLNYFGQNQMAAWQPKNIESRNKDLVKYRPTWGLGPKGMPGSHAEGWTPEIANIMRDEAMVEVDDPTIFPFKKKIPWAQAMGLYWTGNDVSQLNNQPSMPGMSRRPGAPSSDKADGKQGSEMMKGFRMLHKASPELQSMIPISDWDDVSPNTVKGIMSGLQMMGTAQDMGIKRRGVEQTDVNQEAMSSALAAGKDPMAMMSAYAGAGGSDVGGMKTMQDILEGPWKPQVGKMGGKEYMMTSPRSAVWDKSEAESDLKIPYQGPVLKRDGVTFLWSDKDKSYKGSTPKAESPTDQYLRMKLGLPGGGQPKGASKAYGKWSLE